MIFDDIDLTELPPSREDAFILFEKQARKFYEKHSDKDRQTCRDQDGEYVGIYEPEKSYVSCILAFLDEYNLEIDVPDISELTGHDLEEKFHQFKIKISNSILRFSLRKNRIDEGTVGTVISLGLTYKQEIGGLLETIRKIINQEIQDTNKRDKIFSKLAALQSEIDREQTTIDALFGRMLDFSRTIGECAELIEPAITKLERIKNIIWNKSNKVELLPIKKRPKLITKEEEPPSLDDDIPF